MNKLGDQRGILPHTVYNLEGLLRAASRVGKLVFAFFATILIIPYCCYPTLINRCWAEGITGHRITVVRFGEARARPFNKEMPPAEVANADSVELEVRDPRQRQQIPSNGYFQALLDSIASSEAQNLDTQGGVQVRKIPPTGFADTMIRDKVTGKRKSVHGTGNEQLFTDDQIIEKLDIIRKVEIGGGVFASYTLHGKAIIQQQGMRGCTAATAAMLIMDHGKEVDILELQTRNLGTNENQIWDIEKAGLKPIQNEIKTLSQLRQLLNENGSAIVSVHNALGGHVVVVDAISEDLSQVRLRDPFHGWEITVTREAFVEEWQGGSAIQASYN